MAKRERASESRAVLDEEEDGGPRGVRSFWSGTLTFGLVSIPVNLYTAYRNIGTSLRTLAPDGTPLARRYMCSKEGTEIDASAIVRGYEIEKERYVIVTDEELEGLEPKKSRDIALSRFVDVASIPPVYFERAYVLAPSGSSTRAYHLLASSMEKLGKVGVATFVMRGKEHLVAILAENGVLIAETLRFADEVRSPAEVGVSASDRVPAAAVTRFRKLIQRHAAKKLDTKELKDEYWEELRKLAERKHARKKDVVATAEDVSEAAPEEGESNVIDIMEALKRRLAGQVATDEARPPRAASRGRAPKRTSRKKAPARSTSTRSRGSRKKAS